jgi:transposase
LIPPRWQRELRDLTRQRAQGIGEPSRTVHRMQKVLEDANLKLGWVASEVVGYRDGAGWRPSSRGESNPEQLADLAQRRLRGKIPQVPEARFGNPTEQPRWRLSLLWDQRSARLDERIAQLRRPQQPALEKVDAIAGMDRRVAEVGLAQSASYAPETHQHVLNGGMP